MSENPIGRVVRIAPASLDMLPEILFLEETCFSTPWTRKMLEAELTGNRFAHFLIARGENGSGTSPQQVVGYLCFWIVFEEVRLMNLAVTESMRRRGVGTALVSKALQAGLRHAATRAVLEVRASNQAAQTLYRGMGFRHVSTRKGYYSNPIEDAVLMELEPLAGHGLPANRRVNIVGEGTGQAH